MRQIKKLYWIKVKNIIYNRDKIFKTKNEYYETNKATILQNIKDYYEINKDRLLEHSKEYHKLNKVKLLHQQNEYSKNIRNTNFIFRLIENNRNRIRNALQSNNKANMTIDLLGCDKNLF